MAGVTWRTLSIPPTLREAATRTLSGQRLTGGSGQTLPVWRRAWSNPNTYLRRGAWSSLRTSQTHISGDKICFMPLCHCSW